MEAHEDELGPIDIVVIAYPAGAPMTGDAVPIFVDLVERGIIRVLDVLFVMQNEDGTVSGFEATDLDGDSIGDFKVFEGASTGLLGEDDVAIRRRDARARDRCGDDRLRESLGGSVRGRRASQRRRAGGQSAHHGAGADGCARHR